MPRRMSANEIAEDLADRITSGEKGYEPGDKLPSYRELAVLYDVGATTISVVILILKERGLVEGAVGQGVFVVDELPRRADDDHFGVD